MKLIATPLGYGLTVSGIGVLAAVSSYRADANEPGISNPSWTSHAPFLVDRRCCSAHVARGLRLKSAGTGPLTSHLQMFIYPSGDAQ